jgi:hypothetical protein
MSCSREKVQRSTLQLDQTRRWASNINKFFVAAGWQEPVNFDDPKVLPSYFQKLDSTLDKLVKEARLAMILQESAGKQLRSMATREMLEETKLIGDKNFLRSNCR